MPALVPQRLSFDDEIVRAVGVSHYQDALRRSAGAEGPVSIRRDVEAALVPEPENPHDPNAVRVEVDGELVGYLARDDALRYGPAVRRLREHGRLLVSDAVISGRGEDSETPNLGLFLSLPSATEADMETRRLVAG